ncbi:MAG: hypothetical protein ACPHID_08810 [Thermoplasmatota archaeon]
MNPSWRFLLLVLLVPLMPGAQAAIEGDCDVAIQGQDVRGRGDDVSDAILVREGDNITYEVRVDGPARHFVLIAEVGPYEVIIDERNFTRGEAVTTITGNTTFEGLPGGAAGTYRYRGEVTEWSEDTCIGTMLVRIVPDSPFTPVMLGALAVAGAGSASIILLLVRGYQDTREIYDVVKDYVDEARDVAGSPAEDGEEE